MPSKTKPPTSKSGSNNISRARRLLRGVQREDSDDELGDEDLPWNWIYPPEKGGGAEQTIIGAKMGSFEVSIGDCLLIKGEGLDGEAYVGMICEFQESGEEKEMTANIMWFSTEFEVKNKEKKRKDFLPNELYINPSYNHVPLSSINGTAKVLSLYRYNELYPDGVPKRSKEYGKVFICRRGCNTRTATYTEEFIWEDIWKGRDTDIFAIGDLVAKGTKASRRRMATATDKGDGKRKRKRAEDDEIDHDWDKDFQEEDGDNEDQEEEDFGTFDEEKAPRTPSKKRQKMSQTTPSRRTPSKKFTTPTHKRITVKKPLLFTPLSTRTLSPGTHLSTPYALARHRLHVSTLPATLPCREAEFTEVYTHLSAAITEGTGSCIYISGTPGTGKTATVREVITQLQHQVAAEDLEDFTFVEINGMKVTDPHQAYSLLWEAIKGDRVSASSALGLLEREFSTPSPRRVPCVVLMDELDQLVTRGQGVMYNFFNWPGGLHSRLIVLAVANTMDLPERTLSNKISSRLGLTRITFPGYTHSQLITIIQSRLSGVPGNVVDPDAIQFASRKVAAVSGDARRALDICRRAVEIVEYSSASTSAKIPGTPSKRARAKEIEGAGGGLKAGGRVTIAVVKQAINEATSSPVQVYLRGLPLSAKVLLAAILARMRRSGVGENLMADVIDEAERMCKMADKEVIALLLGSAGGSGIVIPKGDKRKTTITEPEAPRMRGLATAVGELCESGVLGMETRRGERGGRVRLNFAEEEVKAALRDDVQVGGMIGRS